jgi:hypothetical protein
MPNATITAAGKVLTYLGIIDTVENNGGSHINGFNTDLQVAASLSTLVPGPYGNVTQIVVGQQAFATAVAQTLNDAKNGASTLNYISDGAYLTGDTAIVFGGIAGLRVGP